MPEFDQFCTEWLIITLCIPSHSLHLLQPLDVGCFSPLKTIYHRLVVENARLGINHVDKQEFLSIYQQAHTEALSIDNIYNSFTATRIVPFNPKQVLSQLQIRLRMPSPIAPRSIQWQSGTPYNITDLEHQVALLKGLIQQHPQGLPTPTNNVLNQLVKGCQMAIHNAVLLASENTELCATNKKQKAKREAKRTYIANGGTLTVAEGARLAQQAQESQNEVVVDRLGNG